MMRWLCDIALLVAGGLLVVAPVQCHLLGRKAHARALRQEQVRADLSQLHQALDAHWAQHRAWPDGLQRLFRAGSVVTLPVDPWGRPYRYVSAGMMAYLGTFGADGKPNGVGEDADTECFIDARAPRVPEVPSCW